MGGRPLIGQVGQGRTFSRCPVSSGGRAEAPWAADQSRGNRETSGGGGGSVTRLIPLPGLLLESRFPYSTTTVYSGNSRGKYQWLTRRGPDGRLGRILWVIENSFNEFARNRGMSYQLPDDGRAVEVVEGWEKEGWKH